MTAPQIAIVRTFNDLHRALRKRVDQISMSQEKLEEISGIDWVDKILCNPPQRRPKLPNALVLVQSLGMMFVLIEDPEAMARIASGIGSRTHRRDIPPRAQIAAYERRAMRKHMKMVRAMRQITLSPAERSRLARLAALARWKQWRRNRRKRACSSSTIDSEASAM
jgi:hypothetical protein